MGREYRAFDESVPRKAVPREYDLFVVGASSPRPEDWTPWEVLSLVVAEDEDEARELAGLGNVTVQRVDMSRAGVVMRQSEPRGEDA